jgi:hypothetical protein
MRKYKLVSQEAEKNDGVENFYGDVNDNGKEHKFVNTLHIYSDDDDRYQIWINNDPQNPLIIKMSIGWKIELKEVKN